MLERLAKADPKRALSLAQSEPNILLKAQLINAVLRGWAQVHPLDAARWAVARPKESDRFEGLRLVLSSAVKIDATGAIRTTQTLMAEQPDEALGYGGSLIEALSTAGNFAAAAEFATSGDEHQRVAWVADAYVKWAIYQPQQSAESAHRIVDSTTRIEALQGVIGGWSITNPAEAMQFASQLPAGAERGPILSLALQQWAHVDPVAASQWIEHNEVGEDMDRGVAAIATTDALKPSVAAQWAEIIVNPELRSQTLADVLTEWVRTDPTAARKYFETTTQLRDEDRAQIAEMLASASSS